MIHKIEKDECQLLDSASFHLWKMSTFTKGKASGQLHMEKKDDKLFSILIGAIAFTALQLAVYYVCSYLLSSTPAEDAEAGSIVRNWNKVMYFILVYVAVMVVTLQLTSSKVPKRFRKHVLFWFYVSLPFMLVQLVLIFR